MLRAWLRAVRGLPCRGCWAARKVGLFGIQLYVLVSYHFRYPKNFPFALLSLKQLLLLDSEHVLGRLGTFRSYFLLSEKGASAAALQSASQHGGFMWSWALSSASIKITMARSHEMGWALRSWGVWGQQLSATFSPQLTDGKRSLAYGQVVLNH